MFPRDRFLIATAFIAALTSQFAPLGFAQTFPNKPIRILVPFVAGGSSDIVARAIASKLPESFPGVTVIVDNKPGANGSIAGEMLARAPADGYTLLVGPTGMLAINPALYKNLPYQPLRDFDILTVAIRTAHMLVANPTFPSNTLAEFIAHLKKNPGKVSFASSGTGSSDHLCAEIFWQQTGTTGIHVPYKGNAAAMTDLLGGTVDVAFLSVGATSSHVKDGRLKAITVASAKRASQLPTVPTMAESGLANFEVYAWQAVMAPKGMPNDVLAKLHQAISAALSATENRRRLDDMGYEVAALSPAASADFLKAETARWQQVVNAGKITLD